MALSLSKNHSFLFRFLPSKDINNMQSWLYLLRLKSGSLYVGSTTDLKQRYNDHCAGNACRTTNLDPPTSLVYSEDFETFSDARKREAQIKRWTRAKKEALVSGDMTKLKMLSKSERIKYPEPDNS